MPVAKKPDYYKSINSSSVIIKQEHIKQEHTKKEETKVLNCSVFPLVLDRKVFK